MSHTVTITRLPDEESDDYEYEFGGTHGFDCEVLHACKRKACQAMNPEYAPFDERVRHGKLHTHRDGDWLVESDDCALGYKRDEDGPDPMPTGFCWEWEPRRRPRRQEDDRRPRRIRSPGALQDSVGR